MPSVHLPYMARDLRIEFRVDDEEKSQIVGMAKAAGYETGDWIRRMLLRPEFSQPQVIVPPMRALEAALGSTVAPVAPDAGFESQAPASPRASEPERGVLDRRFAEELLNGGSDEPRPSGVVSTARFMCPRNCKPDWRPTSENAKCPVCSRRVVPEPE